MFIIGFVRVSSWSFVVYMACPPGCFTYVYQDLLGVVMEEYSPRAREEREGPTWATGDSVEEEGRGREEEDFWKARFDTCVLLNSVSMPLPVLFLLTYAGESWLKP